jgi:hypothetical protein
LAVILRAAVERAKIDPKVVDDIQTGNVLQELGGIKVGRAAMFAAGKSSNALSPKGNIIYTLSLKLLLMKDVYSFQIMCCRFPLHDDIWCFESPVLVRLAGLQLCRQCHPSWGD